MKPGRLVCTKAGSTLLVSWSFGRFSDSGYRALYDHPRLQPPQVRAVGPSRRGLLCKDFKTG